MKWSRALGVGLLTAAGVVLFAGLVQFVLRPLHLAGYGQWLSGYLIGLDHVLLAPGGGAARRLGLVFDHHRRWDEWWYLVGLNALIWFGIGLVLAIVWQWLTPRPQAAAPTRRRFLARTAQVAAGGVMLCFSYALVVEPRWFTITRRALPIRDLPPELDGLRLVQLTDLHHGPWLSIEHVRQVVDAANTLEPDVVLLTGDYVSESPDYIGPVVAELTRLKARLGVVAILGNHDWWEGGPRIQQELTRAGFPLLDNTRLILTPQRQWAASVEKGLAICGVGDLWTDEQDYDAALAGLPDDMPRLLLSHNPDVAEEEAFRLAGHRVDCMISGHTHGGQIQVPFMGTPVVPSMFGQKYASGLVNGPICPVFICRGIGLSVLPLRMGVTPEIAVLELVGSR